MSSPGWVDLAIDALEAGAPAVARVLLASTRGSTPREAGTWLLVHPHAVHGTIGGGRLEWEALALARAQLADTAGPEAIAREFVLGPELAQCCGGRAMLWVERLTRADLPALRSVQLALRNAGSVRVETSSNAGGITRRVLRTQGPRPFTELRATRDVRELVEELRATTRALLLFGAGHVGQAVARVVRELPDVELRWLDTRAAINHRGADEIGYRHVADPVAIAAAAPAGARVLVMTHDHALDFALCEAALRAGRADWIGLIASASKAARFRSRLARAGLADACARRLNAPIGLPAIRGKAPGVIAVSVVAQLLSLDGAVEREVSVPALTCDARDCHDCGAAHVPHRRPA